MQAVPTRQHLMSRHPLDISEILIDKGIELNEKYSQQEQVQTTQNQEVEEQIEEKSEQAESHQAEPIQQNKPVERMNQEQEFKIQSEYWNELNTESRRMLCSRSWKHIDFNPMLAELQDLSKLSEKWLRWAIPTYANGLKEGPIRDWLDGKNRDNDFHYVLVGEHLRYFKEIRQKKKEEKENQAPNQGNTEQINAAIEELDTHINWFQNFINDIKERTK